MRSPTQPSSAPASDMAVIWEFPKIRGTFKGIHKGSFKGIYKGSIKGLGFPKIGGTLFWGPYKKGPTI